MWGIVNRSFWGSILNRTTQYNGMSQGFWRTAQMCKELQAQTFVQRVVVFFESFLCPAKETVDKIRKKLKTRVDTVHLPKNNYFWSYLIPMNWLPQVSCRSFSPRRIAKFIKLLSSLDFSTFLVEILGWEHDAWIAFINMCCMIYYSNIVNQQMIGDYGRWFTIPRNPYVTWE